MLDTDCPRLAFSKTPTQVTTPTNSRDEILRRHWLAEFEIFKSDVLVCQEAIFGIPGQISISRHSMEMDQLNLAASLAQCHAQLEVAFAMVPTDVSA